MQEQYILTQGQRGADRLKLLAELSWPGSEQFLLRNNLHGGMRCLDVGCGAGVISEKLLSLVGERGEVTGVDIDDHSIAIARERLAGVHNIHFSVTDIDCIQCTDFPESFDFIYCRFILEHMKHPEDTLSSLMRHLKLGGFLVAEDIDCRGFFCYPEHDSYQFFAEKFEQLLILRNGNPRQGAELVHLFKNRGLEVIRFEIDSHCYLEGAGKDFIMMTFIAIKDALINEGLTSEDEFQRHLTELQHYMKGNDNLIGLPRYFRVAGRRRL